MDYQKIIDEQIGILEDQYNMNRHDDFRSDTIEFEVKNWPWPVYEDVKQYVKSKEDYNEQLDHIWVDGNLINRYGDLLFADIQRKVSNFFDDWTFAGRSNGWWALLFDLKDESWFDDENQYIVYLKKLIKKAEIADTMVEKYKQGFKKYIIAEFKSFYTEHMDESKSAKLREEIKTIIRGSLSDRTRIMKNDRYSVVKIGGFRLGDFKTIAAAKQAIKEGEPGDYQIIDNNTGLAIWNGKGGKIIREETGEKNRVYKKFGDISKENNYEYFRIKRRN